MPGPLDELLGAYPDGGGGAAPVAPAQAPIGGGPLDVLLGAYHDMGGARPQTTSAAPILDTPVPGLMGPHAPRESDYARMQREFVPPGEDPAAIALSTPTLGGAAKAVGGDILRFAERGLRHPGTMFAEGMQPVTDLLRGYSEDVIRESRAETGGAPTLTARAKAAAADVIPTVVGAAAGGVQVAESVYGDVAQALGLERKTPTSPTADIVRGVAQEMGRMYAPTWTTETSDNPLAPPPPEPGELTGAARREAHPMQVGLDVLTAIGLAGGAAGLASRAIRGRAPTPYRAPGGGRLVSPDGSVMRDGTPLRRAPVELDAPGPRATIERIDAVEADVARGAEGSARPLTAGEPKTTPAARAPVQRPPMPPIDPKTLRMPAPTRYADPAWAGMTEAQIRARLAERSGPAIEWQRGAGVEPTGQRYVPPGGAGKLTSRPFAGALADVTPARPAAKIPTANGAVEVRAGDVLNVGGKRFEIGAETAMDPVTSRRVAEAVGGGRPTKKGAAKFASQSTGVVPVKATAPLVRDVVTGKDYAVKFTGEASETRVAKERARRTEKRRRMGKPSERGMLFGGRGGNSIPATETVIRDIATLGRGLGKGASVVHDVASRAAHAVVDVAGLGARKATPYAAKLADIYTDIARPFTPLHDAIETLGDRIGLVKAKDAALRGAGKVADVALQQTAGRVAPDTPIPPAAQIARDLTKSAHERLDPKTRGYLGKFAVEYDKRIQSLLTRVDDVFASIPEEVAHEWTLETMNHWTFSDADPTIQKLMQSSAPAVKRFRQTVHDLGQELIQLNLIDDWTRDHRAETYFPRLYQEVRKSMRDMLVDEGILKRVNEGHFKGRKRSDVQYLAKGGETDFRVLLTEGFKHLALGKDRAQFLNTLANDPSITVVVDDLIRHREWQDNAKRGIDSSMEDLSAATVKAVNDMVKSGEAPSVEAALEIVNQTQTLGAAIERTNARRTKLYEKRSAKWAETPEVAGQKETGAQPSEWFVEHDQKIHAAHKEWDALVKIEQRLGDVPLDAVRKHIEETNAKIASDMEARAKEAQSRGFVHLSTLMERVGRPATDSASRWWGAMRDGWVDPAVADSIGPMMEKSTDIAKQMDAVVGIWKMLHTQYNVPSHGTNFVGASLWAWMHGVTLPGQIAFGLKAITRLANPADEFVMQLREAGLRMAPTIDPSEVSARIAKAAGRESVGDLRGARHVEAAMRRGASGRVYGLNDSMFRVAAAEYFMEVRGLSLEDAVARANKAVPDPSAVPPLLRRATRSAVGKVLLPQFMSYSAQIIGQIPDVAARDPIRFAVLAYMSSIVAYGMIEAGYMTAQEWRDRKAKRGETLGNGYGLLPHPEIPLGVRDAEGNMMFASTRANPLAGGGMGKESDLPAAIQLYVTAQTGNDPRTKRPVKDWLRWIAQFAINSTAARAVDIAYSLFDDTRRVDIKTGETITPEKAIGQAAKRSAIPGGSPTTDDLHGYAGARVKQRFMQFAIDQAGRENPVSQAEFDATLERIMREEGFDPDYNPATPRNTAPRHPAARRPSAPLPIYKP